MTLAQKSPVLTIAIVSRKGGAGKTTTALNLAGVLAERNARVLLIDLDPQASLTRLVTDARQSDDDDDSAMLTPVGIGERLLAPRKGLAGLTRPVFANVDLVPGDRSIETAAYALTDDPTGPFRLRKLLASVTGYDVIVVDTPPALGFALNSAILAASVAIVPTMLAQQDVDALGDTLGAIERLSEFGTVERAIILPNAYRHDGNDRQTIAVLGEAYADLLADPIPLTVTIKYALAARHPISLHEPTGLASAAYRSLAGRVMEGIRA